MGLFNQFPFTNFHEMNLDWIVTEIQNIKNDINNIDNSIIEDIKKYTPAFTREYISINDYGAKPNDETFDNSEVINKCIEISEQSNIPVVIPSGVYYISSPIIMKNSTTISGLGCNNSTIKLSNNAVCDILITDRFYELLNSDYSKNDTMPGNITISDLSIDGNNADSNGILLFAYNVVMKNLFITNIGKTAIKMYRVGNWIPRGTDGHFENTNANQLINIIVNKCGETGIYCNGVSDSYYENIIIMNTSLKENNKFYGLHFEKDPISQSSAGRIVRMHCWSDSTSIRPKYQLYAAGTQEIECTASHFEGGYESCVYVGSSTSFSTCRFYAGTIDNIIHIDGSYNGFSNCLIHQGIHKVTTPIYVNGHANYIEARYTSTGDNFVAEESAEAYNNIFILLTAQNRNSRTVDVVKNLNPKSTLIAHPNYNFPGLKTNQFAYNTDFTNSAQTTAGIKIVNNDANNLQANAEDIIYIKSNANSISVNVNGINRPTYCHIIIKNESETRTIITIGDSTTQLNNTTASYIGVDGNTTASLYKIDSNSWITV